MHERFVIDAEFSDILTNAQETIFDFIHAFCYGGLDGKYTQSSLSYNILGTRHHIRKVDLTYVSLTAKLTAVVLKKFYFFTGYAFSIFLYFIFF